MSHVPIRPGDAYLDCDGFVRTCTEADGDEVLGAAPGRPALWCSLEHCRVTRLATVPVALRNSIGMMRLLGTVGFPSRCGHPRCVAPDICEGTHAVPSPKRKPPRKHPWQPTRKWTRRGAR